VVDVLGYAQGIDHKLNDNLGWTHELRHDREAVECQPVSELT
jgi:hypothetical protein